jgi:hypothetical protein
MPERAGGYAGDGGPATSAQLSIPLGISLDRQGNLFIADSVNSVIRRVDAVTGIITTVAGNGTHGYAGDNGPATSAALNSPSGVAVDGLGNLFIADEQNHVIRRVVAAAGIISTVAGDHLRGGGFAGDGGPASAALNSPAPWPWIASEVSSSPIPTTHVSAAWTQSLRPSPQWLARGK